MKLPAWTFWMVCALAMAAWAAAQSSDRSVSPTSAPTTRPANELRIAPSDPTEVPITLPTSIKPSRRRRAVLPGGVMIIDRIASIAKDARGEWSTIKDRKVGVLYLLPCESLEAVEKELAENPKAKFKLSGEVHRYRGGYYMLLHRALLIPKLTSSAPAVTSRPTTKPATTTATSKPAASLVEPTSQPATSRPSGASADDVAAKLLGKTPSRPIVPDIKPKLPKVEPSMSGVPSGKTLRPGPGKNAVHRLARLLYRKKGQKWSRVAFEADNTLREPPMRVLPNIYLERMETLSSNGKASGAIFHISGEVYRYKGKDYLLLRAVIRKQNLGQL